MTRALNLLQVDCSAVAFDELALRSAAACWFEAETSRPRRWIDKHRLVRPENGCQGCLDWSIGCWRGEPCEPSRLLALPPPLGPLAVAICYELSDAHALAEAVRGGGDWILTLSNLDPYRFSCSSNSCSRRKCVHLKSPLARQRGQYGADSGP